MLICYRLIGDTSARIGLALNQWKVEGKPRIYVLLPQDTKKNCEVDVVYPPEFEWCLTESDSKAITFDSRLLNKDEEMAFSKQAEKDLYFVWDDGASRHPERATKLYNYFKPVIEQYRKSALNIKNSLYEKEYQEQLKEAKNNGWDSGLVSRKVPVQAYDSY